MGASTILFVATKEDNFLKMMPKVLKELNKWQKKSLDQYWNDKGFESRLSFLFRNKEAGVNSDLKDFSNGISDISSYDFRSFHINFMIEGNGRSLFVTHACSMDYSDTYDGEKIIFSLGSNEQSKEMMMVIAEVTKEFGDTYFTINDCNDEFVKL